MQQTSANPPMPGTGIVSSSRTNAGNGPKILSSSVPLDFRKITGV
jgi:hypothetical protein